MCELCFQHMHILINFEFGQPALTLRLVHDHTAFPARQVPPQVGEHLTFDRMLYGIVIKVNLIESIIYYSKSVKLCYSDANHIELIC